MRYLALLLLLAACGDSSSPPAEPALQSLGSFANPTYLTAPPGDSSRMVVTERAGRVRLFKNDVLQAGSFLDLRGHISAADEDGLYSLAFHPQYATNAGTCNSAGLTPPVLEYQHAGGACDVQGGYVYRGTQVTQLIGRYLYADYCTGVVSSFMYTGGAVSGGRNWPTLSLAGDGIVSFGEDARGELYLVTYAGPLYRIVEAP